MSATAYEAEKHEETPVLDRGKDSGIELGTGMAGLRGMPREYSGWDVYNNEAKKVDTELVNDWRGSLESLLLFSGIFAVVLTAFIIESKKMLEVDPTDVMVDVMIFFTNNLASGNHTPYSRVEFVPTSWSVNVNCLFFASLSTSLVAALASVVALQWVEDYEAAITRGGSSPEDRAKRRQFRYAGVVRWKMSEIIAALPLLLYCSVLLFFTGLSLWMWSVHHIVRLVVAGGAVAALLFYGITTFLAVAFVSTPFKTPLGRWIYSLTHLPFSLAYSLSLVLHIPSIPTWLKNRHLTYTTSRKREDNEVDKGSLLSMDALVWLANHLSISQDSYDRLLLVVSELPKLEMSLFASPSFMDAPWYSIFDLLGLGNIKTDPEQSISKQEMHAVAILAQCYRISAVYEIIRPRESMVYCWDDTEAEYWSQCCETVKTQWPQPQSLVYPNAMFLLLRDIPLPSIDTAQQLDFTVRLSRWRNSQPSNHFQTSLPTPSTDSSVVVVGQFANAKQQELWFTRNDSSLYDATVGRMVRLAVENNVIISPKFLDSLRWRLEYMLLKHEASGTNVSCLAAPLDYREALETQDSRFLSLHYAFTVLLARNLHRYSGSERIQRAKEVMVMLWIAPVDRGAFASLAGRELGMEKFFDANKATIMEWITNSNSIPYILEILQHLAAAQEEQPDIGPLWRITTLQLDTKPNLLEALGAFDQLISTGVTTAQHLSLIDLVCRDLELGPPDIFKRYSTLPYSRLEDPCLLLLSVFVSKSSVYCPDHLVEETITATFQPSWDRVATFVMLHHVGTDLPPILQLQAYMTPLFPDHTKVLCRRALQQPKVLTHLQRVFEHPVPCPGHFDGQSHLFFHLFDTLPILHVSMDMKALTNTPMTSHGFDSAKLLVVFVFLDGNNAAVTDALVRHIDPQCLDQLSGPIDALRSSQVSLLMLLWDLSSFLISDALFWVLTEDIAIIAVCIVKALDLPCDQRAAPVIRPLVKNLWELIHTRRFRRRGGFEEERETARLEVIGAINQLDTHLASMTVFGGRNCQMLSCARGTSPATGWLSPFLD